MSTKHRVLNKQEPPVNAGSLIDTEMARTHKQTHICTKPCKFSVKSVQVVQLCNNSCVVCCRGVESTDDDTVDTESMMATSSLEVTTEILQLFAVPSPCQQPLFL